MYCNGVYKVRKLATQAVAKMINDTCQKSYVDFDDIEVKEGEKVHLVITGKYDCIKSKFKMELVVATSKENVARMNLKEAEKSKRFDTVYWITYPIIG